MFKPKAASWISLYFSGLFFAWGIFLPFWALWLESEGLDPSQIGLLLGFGMLARFLGNVLLMPRIKSAKHLLPGIRWVSFASILVVASLCWLNGYFWLTLLTLAANFFIATLIPLGDAVATKWVSQLQLDYGRVRVFGSIAFIVSSTLLGIGLTYFSHSLILYATLGSLVLMWGLSLLTPAAPLVDEEHDGEPVNNRLWAVLKQKHALKFIAVTALIQGSHAAYYAYSTLYWKSIGYAESTIGYLWSIGVALEMAILIFGSKWFKSWNANQMFLLAAVGGVIRWGVFGSTEFLSLMMLSQGLHALTFALTQLAAIKYIASEAPKSQAIPLQALYSAIALNMGTALLTFISSALYEPLGAGIFLMMASLSALAIPLLLINGRAAKRST
ncbi:3-phenylpropionate MFS transporter [Agarivorans sp. TSD2052]|uniref:3-phenylpropionate MFS transporter n=1 Tax=Agarivorans sp. TSD2052 TaxID=2937286 RepID=UPI00200FB405|nr:3-phenylpropionate MFS transporter [Agarivorans sp. TSD2052]UPW17225.1 3-phenylpropionate MFS transporter [Agarivorans sp. TSD2052]